MLGGSSSSSSESTSNTEQYDERVAASDQGVAIGARATVNVDVTSPEAWELAGKLIGETGDLGDNAITSALSFATDIGEAALDLVDANTREVLAFMDERSQTEAQSLAEQALKLAVPVALVAVAVWGLRRA